jgi:hypothetical protein
MTKDRIVTEPVIDLDPSELLGLSQVAEVSGNQPSPLARLLSKIGGEGAEPVQPVID